ncbi:hypothetical protein ACVWXO_001342 [Bradyrhizobium sp. LM2.7]
MPAGVGGGGRGRIQPATSSILDPTADSMPATPDQVTYCEVINARRGAQPYFVIYPSRGCVPSQQSILPPLRNVIRNWRLGTIFGRIIERCWCLECQMLLRDGKLPLVFQGTAAKPLARRIPARSRHCLASRTAGEWCASREVSDRSGRQAAPDFARSDIRFSLFDGECPRRKSMPVVLPTDESHKPKLPDRFVHTPASSVLIVNQGNSRKRCHTPFPQPAGAACTGSSEARLHQMLDFEVLAAGVRPRGVRPLFDS